MSDNRSTVRLWDLTTGRFTRALTGHSNRVRSLVFAPGGRMLASAGMDNTVRLWDVATGSPLGMLKGHQGNFQSLAFSPEGTTLPSDSADSNVILWHLDQLIVLQPKEARHDADRAGLLAAVGQWDKSCCHEESRPADGTHQNVAAEHVIKSLTPLALFSPVQTGWAECRLRNVGNAGIDVRTLV